MLFSGGVAQSGRAIGSYPVCHWFKSSPRYHPTSPVYANSRGYVGLAYEASCSLVGDSVVGQSPLPFCSYKGTYIVARPRIIIPALLILIIAACQLHATEVDSGSNNDSVPREKESCEAPKCKTGLRGTLTEEEESQMKQMQAVLYDMREDTWDDRYRY